MKLLVPLLGARANQRQTAIATLDCALAIATALGDHTAIKNFRIRLHVLQKPNDRPFLKTSASRSPKPGRGAHRRP